MEFCRSSVGGIYELELGVGWLEAGKDVTSDVINTCTL